MVAHMLERTNNNTPGSASAVETGEQQHRPIAHRNWARGMAVGEEGLGGEEREGPNLNHVSTPSQETILERKRNMQEVFHKGLKSNQISLNHCPYFNL